MVDLSGLTGYKGGLNQRKNTNPFLPQVNGLEKRAFNERISAMLGFSDAPSKNFEIGLKMGYVYGYDKQNNSLSELLGYIIQ